MISRVRVYWLVFCFISFSIITQSNQTVISNGHNDTNSSYKPIVQQLQQHVETNKTFAQQLNQTFIEGTELNNMPLCNYTDMYNFFNNILTTAFNATNSLYIVSHLYNYSNTPTGSKLMLEPTTNQWLSQWLNEWKIYLDSYNSTNVLASWFAQTNMSDFIVPTNGFESFNDFLTRKLRPGVRPIAEPSNNSIIVAPCDANVHTITNNLIIGINDTFSIKNISYNITAILGSQEKAELFNGGTMIQLGLDVFNYHRYHSCVTGYIKEIDQIGGVYYYWPYNITGDGSKGVYSNEIGIKWDELNRRGIVYIEYQPGMSYGDHEWKTSDDDKQNINIKGNINGDENRITIALIAIGMAEVSSVNFEINPDMQINKGDEIGYFAYGGSAMAILFPRDSIHHWIAKENTTIQMGQPVAIAAT